MGSLIILTIAVPVGAVLAGLLWTVYPSIGIFAGLGVSGALAHGHFIHRAVPVVAVVWPWWWRFLSSRSSGT
jgi:hypothetical protein